jgi:hypothetical protein
LEEDLAVAGLGKGKENALYVLVPNVQPNEITYTDMDVDSSCSDNVTLRVDGIDIDTEHLDRIELVGKLNDLGSRHAIVLLTAPAGSGKSSLYKLYKYIVRNVKVIGISCLEDRSTFELLAEKGLI